jgi:hypothetical protein
MFCFETGYYYTSQTGLEFTILLSLSPECWNYRLVPLVLAIIHLYLRPLKCFPSVINVLTGRI